MCKPVNPFGDPAALTHSNYSSFRGGRLRRSGTNEPPTSLTVFVHDALRALVLNNQFSCMGGKAAVRQGHYGFGLYDVLGVANAAVRPGARSVHLQKEFGSLDGSFTTYLASFAGPYPADEADFERMLWQTLQHLNDMDATHHEWVPSVSADPRSQTFSFSFGDMAFFVNWPSRRQLTRRTSVCLADAGVQSP